MLTAGGVLPLGMPHHCLYLTDTTHFKKIPLLGTESISAHAYLSELHAPAPSMKWQPSPRHQQQRSCRWHASNKRTVVPMSRMAEKCLTSGATSGKEVTWGRRCARRRAPVYSELRPCLCPLLQSECPEELALCMSLAQLSVTPWRGWCRIRWDNPYGGEGSDTFILSEDGTTLTQAIPPG